MGNKSSSTPEKDRGKKKKPKIVIIYKKLFVVLMEEIVCVGRGAYHVTILESIRIQKDPTLLNQQESRELIY